MPTSSLKRPGLMPHTLRSLKLADNEVAELTMLRGFDDDLAGQIMQTSNRIRGLLTQIHQALERVLGPPWTAHAPYFATFVLHFQQLIEEGVGRALERYRSLRSGSS